MPPTRRELVGPGPYPWRAGSQQVVAVTAAGGRGTVLAASDASNRLYAIADL